MDCFAKCVLAAALALAAAGLRAAESVALSALDLDCVAHSAAAKAGAERRGQSDLDRPQEF